MKTLILIWYFGVFIIAYLGFLFIPNSNLFNQGFFSSFANWDGGHYLGIAEFGYSDVNTYQYAFFPLYPLVIRGLTFLTRNYLLSALLISFISSYFGVLLFYKLVKSEFNQKIAKKSVIYLFIFPTSFFFVTAYSEGLFFLLSVSTFYALYKKRLLLATVFAFLATLTRFSGLAVALSLLIFVLYKYKFNQKTWFVIFAPLGIFIYMIFLHLQMGNALFFIEAEKHWGREIAVPGTNLLYLWLGILNKIEAWQSLIIDLIITMFGIGIVFRTIRFLPLQYVLYGLFSILIPLFTTSLVSFPRFLLPVFPIFIMLGLIKNKRFEKIYLLFSGVFLIVFIVMFINGYWVS